MAGSNILVAAAITPSTLLSQKLGTVDTVLFTVGAGTSLKVAQGAVYNRTGSTVTVYLSILMVGQSLGADHLVMGYALRAGDTRALGDIIGGAMLGPGDRIAGYASAVDAVSITLSGTVQS